jgi:hypothetical protein
VFPRTALSTSALLMPSSRWASSGIRLLEKSRSLEPSPVCTKQCSYITAMSPFAKPGNGSALFWPESWKFSERVSVSRSKLR